VKARDDVAKQRALGRRQLLFVELAKALDRFAAALRLDELEQLHRPGLGRGALFRALNLLLERIAHPLRLLLQVLALERQLADAGVEQEPKAEQAGQPEQRVGGDGVPPGPALVRGLTLANCLDVRAQRVRDVVGLDDQTSRLDDLLLDLANFFVDFAHLYP
jgi:hypothetical protein